MREVKFFDTRKWAEHKPHMAQIEVKAGEVKSISNELAEIVVNAGRGEYVAEVVKHADAEKLAIQEEKLKVAREQAASDAEALKAASDAEALRAAEVLSNKKGPGRPRKDKS